MARRPVFTFSVSDELNRIVAAVEAGASGLSAEGRAAIITLANSDRLCWTEGDPASAVFHATAELLAWSTEHLK